MNAVSLKKNDLQPFRAQHLDGSADRRVLETWYKTLARGTPHDLRS